MRNNKRIKVNTNVLLYVLYIPAKTMQLTIMLPSDEAYTIEVPTDASVDELMTQLKVSMMSSYFNLVLLPCCCCCCRPTPP